MTETTTATTEITKPKEGQETGHACPVECRVQNLPEGRELWIVKEPSKGNFHPDDGPMHRDVDTFRGAAYVGNAQPYADQGRKFPIHIVSCSPENGRMFREYIQNAHQSGAWIGLSSIGDGEILATVTVVRRD